MRKREDSWDALFKQIFANFFVDLGVQLTTEYEVSRLPLRIDAVIRCARGDVEKIAEQMPFDFFRGHNLLEFKSPRDPLTVAEYHRIMARAHLYIADTPSVATTNMMICVACSAKPVKVLYRTLDEVRFVPLGNGHYLSDDKIPMRVVVIVELPIERRNYPLLLFSKGKKRREFFDVLIRRQENDYLQLAYELYPNELKEVFEMSRRDYPTLEENIRFIIKDLGLNKILENVDTKDVVEGLGPTKILENIHPDDVAPEFIRRWIRAHKGSAEIEMLRQILSDADNSKEADEATNS